MSASRPPATLVVAVAMLSLGGLWAPAAAQEDSPLRGVTAPLPALRSGVDLVALQVTVEDAGGSPVCDLRTEDFTVFENGVAQVVTTFAAPSSPVDVVLLIDTSGSMTQREGIARQFVRELLLRLRPDDRVSLIIFSDAVHVSQPAIQDDRAVDRALQRAAGSRATPESRGTALHDILEASLRAAGAGNAAAAGIRREAMIVVSDGEDTASIRASPEDLLAAARASSITAFTIVPRQIDATGFLRIVRQAQRAEAESTMVSLARETGGRAFIDVANEALASTSRVIVEELKCQYWLGYEPVPGARGYRNVVVALPGRARFRARTRSGYEETAPDGQGPWPRRPSP